MGLKIEDSIRSELRVTGTQKGGKFICRRTFYCFLCKDCGAEFWPLRSGLGDLTGRCRKCANNHGALITADKIAKRPFEALYNKFAYDRQRVGLVTDISYEDFLEFVKIKECHYCGKEVFWSERNVGKNGSRYNLDRRYNEKGYSKENVVICCWKCNETKSNRFDYDEFLLLAPVLRQIRLAREVNTVPA